MPLQFVLLFAIILSVHNAQGANLGTMEKIVQTCNDNSDCIIGQFCHEKMGHKMCQACIDCESRFFRSSSQKTLCPENWLECGECLPGYQEENLTNSRVRERCIPKDTSEKPPTVKKLSPHKIVGLVVIIAMVIGLVAVICWVCSTMFFKSSDDSNQAHQGDAENGETRELIADPPPPYSERNEQSEVLPECSPNQGSESHSQYYDESDQRSQEFLLSVEGDCKAGATPFNLNGYREHLPERERAQGRYLEFGVDLELELITPTSGNQPDDETNSPDGSIHSEETIASPWEPRAPLAVPETIDEYDEDALLEIPELANINPASPNVPLEAPSGESTTDNSLPLTPESNRINYRSRPYLVSDSGVTSSALQSLNTSSDSVYNRPEDFFYQDDSALDLRPSAQNATIHSAGQPDEHPRPTLFRAFSNIDVRPTTTLNNSTSLTDRGRKRMRTVDDDSSVNVPVSSSPPSQRRRFENDEPN